MAKEYKKISGSTARISLVTRSSSRLYLAKDHILRVNMTGWTENYRRFYFSDIQALVVTRNNWWLIGGIILAGLALVFSLLIIRVQDETAIAVFGTFAVLFGFFSLFFFVPGPSCVTRIYTIAGSESLKSLNRTRKARKFLKLLKTQVDGIQGVLNPGETVPVFQSSSGSENDARQASQSSAQENLPYQY